MEKINLKEYLDVVDSLLYDFDYEYYLAIEEEYGNGLELAVNELSSRFSVITNLGIVASGGSRGVFKLTDSLILKVNFEEGEPYESETVGEYGLWCLLQKNKELNELSKYLVPILQHEGRLTIMPFCNRAELNDLSEANNICDKFNDKGIVLLDTRQKVENIGRLNDRVVICDYGEWITNKDLDKIKEKLITNTMNLFNDNGL